MNRYAAVDIGSNSVRMMVAQIEPSGALTTLAQDRQVTRLGESVFTNGQLSNEATELVCSVLNRMAATWKTFDPLAVRVVATAALRDAQNGAEFLDRTSKITGVPTEIISGQEEARLIHLGVESRWPHPDQRVLIIDIGGGSAEMIEADRGRMKTAFSRPLGAVRLQTVFLKNDPPSPADLQRLNEYIAEKLSVVDKHIQHGGFAHAIGTSATASAVVCAVNRIPRPKRDTADRKRVSAADIRRLGKHLATMNLSARRKVVGLGPRRAEIILPGALVLQHVLETFEIRSLAYCSAGVRDGIIRDLAERGVGRERSRMSREQKSLVERFAKRFGVDLKHARTVAGFCEDLFHALSPLHQLPAGDGRLLEAAAYLRDVGHLISDSGHHKHSFYIVANADLAGFTNAEKRMIALLCRYHRKSMPVLRHSEFQSLTAEQRRGLMMMAPLLRVADALDRSRDQRLESIECEVRNGQVQLRLHSKGDAGLEQWAVELAAPTFRQAYDKTLTVRVV